MHRLISQSRLIKVDIIIIIEATAIQPEAFRDNNYDDGRMNDDLNNNGEVADWILLSCLTNTCIPVLYMHSKAF